MTEYQKGFQSLIKQFPKTFRVLDVGSGGLQGENTTKYLAEHFNPKNITGICSNDHEVKRYQAIRQEEKLSELNIISGDFYKHEFNEQFDLVVLDLNIESNLGRDWTDQGLEKMKSLVKDGGYLINYVMTTHHYGNEETSGFIRIKWSQWWNTLSLTLKDIGKKLRSLKDWEFIACEQEIRRQYILWVLLKKTSGS